MAFKASNSVPAAAYRIVKGAAAQLKVNLQAINTQLAASGADYDYLRDIYRTLARADAQFANLQTTPGLAQYAKDQENDQAYDVAAEFTAMRNTISAATAWMDTNVPTDVTAKTPSQWGDDTLISDAFTPAQTSGLRTALSAVISAID